MNEELKETAKAVQEIAKTTGKAIEASEKLAGFIAKHISEPVEVVFGIISDKLKYIRWERQIRLLEKSKEIIEKKKLTKFRIVPPKFALALIENASLEENDELQDLWAKLLVTSIDPTKEFPRQGFIDILKQLDITDVHILQYLYDVNLKNPITEVYEWQFDTNEPQGILVSNIRVDFMIEEKIFYTAIDNLVRMRLVTAPLAFTKLIDRLRNSLDTRSPVPGFKLLTITSIGVDFVEACMKK